MAIYRHFDSKDALVEALVLDALAEWSAIVAGLPRAEGLAQLEHIGEAFLDFALERPRRFEAAFLLHSRTARRYPDDFVAGLSPAGNVQLGIIEQAMAQGLLEAASPIEIMMTTARCRRAGSRSTAQAGSPEARRRSASFTAAPCAGRSSRFSQAGHPDREGQLPRIGELKERRFLPGPRSGVSPQEM